MNKLVNYLKHNKIKFRILYWSLVVFIFIFIVLPIFFLFYIFNEDQVKQLIVEQFDNKNYHVEVAGHVVPKFWHGLSLDFQDVEVETKNYDTLFKIKHMSCQLSWLDLVFARYKVRRMALNNVEINENNLSKTKITNLFNFSNQRKDVFSRMTILNIYNIYTVDSKASYKISEGSVKIDQSGTGANFELGAKFDNQDTFVIINGKLSSITQNDLGFNDFQVKLYNKKFDLKLNARASYLMSNHNLTLSEIKGSLKKSNFKGDVTAKSFSFTLGGMIANGLSLDVNYGNNIITQNIKVAINQLSLDSTFRWNTDKINTVYLAQYNSSKVKVISTLSGINYSESATSITATSCVNQINLSSPNFVNGNLTSSLSGSCVYFPKQNLFNFIFSGDLNGAPLKLNMQLYKKEKPFLILSGNMDDLDLSRVKVKHDKFLPLLYDKSNLPFNWLSLIDVNGNLTIKHFAFDRINLNNVVTQFFVQNNVLNLNKISASVYKGILNGHASIEKISENNYNIKAKQEINDVSLQDMFDDLFDVQAISGQANLTADIVLPHIHSYDDLYQNLNGVITLGAKNGEFQGVDFNLFVNPTVMNLTEKKSTAFEQLKASFNFNDGISKNSQLNFSSKYVIVNGAGLVDFDKSKLDYSLLIKSALPRNDEKINSVLIPVTVSGNLFSPKVNIKNIHLYTTDIVKPVSVKNPLGHKHSKKHINKHKTKE